MSKKNKIQICNQKVIQLYKISILAILLANISIGVRPLGSERLFYLRFMFDNNKFNPVDIIVKIVCIWSFLSRIQSFPQSFVVIVYIKYKRKISFFFSK